MREKVTLWEYKKYTSTAANMALNAREVVEC